MLAYKLIILEWMVIKKIFSVNSDGKRTELSTEQLVFVNDNGVEVELNLSGGPDPDGADICILAPSDRKTSKFQQILVYSGGSNLIFVKVISLAGKKVEFGRTLTDKN